MLPFFAKKHDPGCARYGYDCDAPNNYYKEWSSNGGSLVFIDGHAKRVTAAGQFDDTRINQEGNKSGEASNDPNAWSGTWYSLCD